MFPNRGTVQLAGGVLLALGFLGLLLWAFAEDASAWGLYGVAGCLLIGATWLYRPDALVKAKKH